MMSHSHKTYCGTKSVYHNLLCGVCEGIAFAVFVAGAYAALTLGAVLDAITAGGH